MTYGRRCWHCGQRFMTESNRHVCYSCLYIPPRADVPDPVLDLMGRVSPALVTFRETWRLIRAEARNGR